MNSQEKDLQKETCYYEPEIRTRIKVIQEQFLLWLFPTLILLVSWQLSGTSFITDAYGYTLLILFYLISATIGSSFRYKSERKTVRLMEQQSKPIIEEFHTGKVETAQYQISKAFILEESEDEGPVYILEIGDNLYTVIGEYGVRNTYSNTPGDIVEIVRLPISKRILSVKWMGEPLSIEQKIQKQILERKAQDWDEGGIIEIKGGLSGSH